MSGRGEDEGGRGAGGGRSAAAFRSLPSVESLLGAPRVAALAPRLGRARLAELCARVLDGWRAEIREGVLDAAGVEERLARDGLAESVEELLRREERRGVTRALNATGVVLHTGLGRAPLHPEAARAMAEAALGYCVLELERESGARGRRDELAGELAARLCGAEAGLAVNNNAAAVVLVLNTFAAGLEVVLSRGELVEIGGSFRMPDVMERAGAVLREVGTTNRTRLDDYRRAAGEETGLLLKVHTSNFRVEGFTAEVTAAELAALGRELGLVVAYDLGSGWIEPSSGALPGLEREPGLRASVRAGVDLVLFSGDKLLGGPQAGIVVGRRRAVEALRQNPLYRALRLDKTALAGLERTLALYLAGREAELPARAMLALGAEELEARARRLAGEASRSGFEARVAASSSQPGSGSAPGVGLPTSVVELAHPALSPERLLRALRLAEPPVFARIEEGRVLLDPRTLLAGDEEALARVLATLAPAG